VAAWVEKQVSPLRRQSAPPPVEMTILWVLGENNNKGKSNDKSNRRSFDFTSRKVRERFRSG
jgi:hypothetical protein